MRFAIGYSIILVLSFAAFFAIRWIGESWVGSNEAVLGSAGQVLAASQPAPSSGTLHFLSRVIVAIVAIVVVSRVLGSIFVWIGQPRVIGEVVAGILLGPSLLGQISTPAMQLLFPGEIMPALNVLAQLGIILYMFLVGLELNAELLRKRAYVTVAISHASIVLPFLLGAILAIFLYSHYAPAGVTFTSFSLFLGIAMSITAFPVLARILSDRGMEQTELGVMALGCAAAGDVTAWCLLALVVGVTQAELTEAGSTIMFAVLYMAFMFLGVRRYLVGWIAKKEQHDLSSHTTAWILVAVLVSSLVTEWIGIHAIFGAFLMGAIIPHNSAMARAFREKLEDVVSILLLPIFFAYTGVQTEIGLLGTPTDWLICFVIILVATLSKFGGTVLAARYSGLPWAQSSALGILMNTRGLMELIVLKIGLDLGVISPRLFAMMVVMALATTIATTPILIWLTRSQPTSSATAAN